MWGCHKDSAECYVAVEGLLLNQIHSWGGHDLRGYACTQTPSVRRDSPNSAVQIFAVVYRAIKTHCTQYILLGSSVRPWVCCPCKDRGREDQNRNKGPYPEAFIKVDRPYNPGFMSTLLLFVDWVVQELLSLTNLTVSESLYTTGSDINYSE